MLMPDRFSSSQKIWLTGGSPVVISASGILQRQQYVHGSKHDITIALHSLVPVILHEFHNCKGHQGTIYMFKAIRRSYWWPICHDVVQYINKCDMCAKTVPNMAKYPQKHLEIPQMPVAVVTIDTLGYLPVTSKGNRWALTVICLNTSYVFAVLMKEKSAENVFQSCLSGILAHPILKVIEEKKMSIISLNKHSPNS